MITAIVAGIISLAAMAMMHSFVVIVFKFFSVAAQVYISKKATISISQELSVSVISVGIIVFCSIYLGVR